jgi:hypothetical protein
MWTPPKAFDAAFLIGLGAEEVMFSPHEQDLASIFAIEISINGQHIE